MQWFGPSYVIERKETPDTLTYTITPQDRVLDGLEILGLFSASVLCFYWEHAAIALFLLLAAAMSAFNQWNASVSVLEASEKGIRVNGQYYPWHTFTSLDYWAGGEDSQSGLYGSTPGWGQGVLLLKEPSETEANKMISEISHRFYYVEMATDDSRGLLDRFYSKPITLGLSGSNDNEKSPLH